MQPQTIGEAHTRVSAGRRTSAELPRAFSGQIAQPDSAVSESGAAVTARNRSSHITGISAASKFSRPQPARAAPRDLTTHAGSPSREPLIDATPTELDLPALRTSSGSEGLIRRLSTPAAPRRDAFVTDEKGQRMRNYQVHEGRNRFLWGGRGMTSGDSSLPFLASFAIATMLPVLFFVFVGSWLWHELAGGKAAAVIVAYLCCIMLSSMLRTAWRDPGIVPRNLDLPDTDLIACTPGAAEDIGGGQAERPRARYIEVKGELVVSKYCETCCSYRPPRTSHCRICDNCVERTDHHCTFLNTCIGRRNYASFLAFLLSAALAVLLVLGLSIGYVATQRPVLSDWHTIGAVAVSVLTLGVGLPISGLLSYHLRLIWLGNTTIERIRPKESMGGFNVYSARSPWQNILNAFCRPMTASSALRSRKYAIEREPS